jgi:hypothetical protein
MQEIEKKKCNKKPGECGKKIPLTYVRTMSRGSNSPEFYNFCPSRPKDASYQFKKK